MNSDNFIKFTLNALNSKDIEELANISIKTFYQIIKPENIKIQIENISNNNSVIFESDNNGDTTKSYPTENQIEMFKNLCKDVKSEEDLYSIREENNSHFSYITPLLDNTKTIMGIIEIRKIQDFSMQDLDTLKNHQLVISQVLNLMNKNSYIEHQIKEKDFTISKLNSEIKDLNNLNMSNITQLVAGLAHEMNNPLAALKGGAEGLKDNIDDIVQIMNALAKGKDFDDDEYNYLMLEGIPDSISAIVSSADRLRDLIVNLKQFSRLGLDDVTSLDLFRRISMIKNQYDEEIEENNIEIEIDVDKNIKVDCFQQEISLVIDQLLQNSIFYVSRSENSKKILIKAKDIDEKHSISILDTGTGISQEIQEKIFHPFFTTKNIGEGMGLGLSVCYGIISKHNGDIFIDKNREPDEEEFITKITLEIPKNFKM